MTTPAPDFMKWVEVSYDGWRLKPDAPAEVRKAYREYIKSLDMLGPGDEDEPDDGPAKSRR